MLVSSFIISCGRGRSRGDAFALSFAIQFLFAHFLPPPLPTLVRTMVPVSKALLQCYVFVPCLRHDDYITSFSFQYRAYHLPSFFIVTLYDAFIIADPSSTQNVCHMLHIDLNSVRPSSPCLSSHSVWTQCGEGHRFESCGELRFFPSHYSVVLIGAWR